MFAYCLQNVVAGRIFAQRTPRRSRFVISATHYVKFKLFQKYIVRCNRGALLCQGHALFLTIQF